MRRTPLLAHRANRHEALIRDLAPILLERADRDLTTAIERELDDATVYPGEKAFRLYDTFGLPRDFIEDVAATPESQSIGMVSIAR